MSAVVTMLAWPSMACTTFRSTPAAKLVVSIVPTLRIGRLDERTVVGSALVAALFGCTCCIMRVSAATELAASSSGLMQVDDGIPGHAGCMGSHGSELAPGRHAALQVARVHRICRMMRPAQLRSLERARRRRGAGRAAAPGEGRTPGSAPPGGESASRAAAVGPWRRRTRSLHGCGPSPSGCRGGGTTAGVGGRRWSCRERSCGGWTRTSGSQPCRVHRLPRSAHARSMCPRPGRCHATAAPPAPRGVVRSTRQATTGRSARRRGHC